MLFKDLALDLEVLVEAVLTLEGQGMKEVDHHLKITNSRRQQMGLRQFLELMVLFESGKSGSRVLVLKLIKETMEPQEREGGELANFSQTRNLLWSSLPIL